MREVFCLEISIVSPEGRQRQIGYVEGNRFISHRNWNEHYFRIYDGFGFNLKIVKGLAEKGVKDIFLFVVKGDETLFFKTTPQTILENGIEYHNKKDIGDIQLVLSLDYFEVGK